MHKIETRYEKKRKWNNLDSDNLESRPTKRLGQTTQNGVIEENVEEIL